jgi:DNA-binding NtrC family response regulator
VREFANVIERAAVVSTGPTLGEDDLPPLADHAAGAHASRDAGKAGEGEEAAGEPADVTLDSVERAHIVRMLERTAWVIEGKRGAAALLGVAPSTLRSRMAQLGIRRASPRG